MSDVREQRIYCAEQIYVPENLPTIIKHYSKAVIKNNPENIIHFSMKYFETLLRQRDSNPDHTSFNEIRKPDSNQIPENEHQVSQEEEKMKRYKSAFDRIDTNGTGQISAFELESMVKRLGNDIQPEYVLRFLKKYDKDNDSLINFNEFVMMMNEISKNK